MTDHRTEKDRSLLAEVDAGAGVAFSFERMSALAVDLFHRAVVARGLRHNHVASVATGEGAPERCRELGTVEFERVEDDSTSTQLLLSVNGGALLSAQLYHRSAHLSVAADSPELAARALATTREAVERPGAPDEVELTSARADPRLGLTHTTRSIPAPEWAEIAGNYTPKVAEQLGRLVACAPTGASRLLILEDAGELIAADARTEAGQALSRLLNFTDGLLGAGTDTLTLISTNEPLDKLHPAIQRPGRTAVRIEFEPLPAGQSNEWLAARDTNERVTRPTTLAELYALLRGHEDQTKQRAPLGFAA